MAGNGGYRPNSGRKTRAEEIKEIEKLNLLLPEAVKTIKRIMRGKSQNLAFYAAKLIIDKCVPDNLNVNADTNNSLVIITNPILAKKNGLRVDTSPRKNSAK